MLTCVNADKTDATLLSTLAEQRFSAITTNALIAFLIPLGYSILKEKYAANNPKETSLMGISQRISLSTTRIAVEFELE